MFCREIAIIANVICYICILREIKILVSCMQFMAHSSLHFRQGKSGIFSAASIFRFLFPMM